MKTSVYTHLLAFLALSFFLSLPPHALGFECFADSGKVPPAWFSPKTRKEKANTLRGSELQKNAVLAPTRRDRRAEKRKGDRPLISEDFSFRYESESTSWKTQLDGNPGRQKSDGESPGIHEQHRLGAYTNVREGDDLNIRLGPEVIVKDSKGRQPLETQSGQPDSELGLGMQLQYKF